MENQEIAILITGEESQAICLEFRKLGFWAYSCDIKSCSGGYPQYHLKMDMYKAISGGWLTTEKGDRVYCKRWQFVFMHPVCTYMAVSGLFRNLSNTERAIKTEHALQDVCKLLNHCVDNGISKFGFENPVSCISTRIFYDKSDARYKVIPLLLKDRLPNVKRFKATQTVQPYEFGEDASKRTCFWLVNMPKIAKTVRFPGRIVDGKERWSNQTDSGQNKLAPSANRAELRSKTYPGIARAMAYQWGSYLLYSHNQLQAGTTDTKHINNDLFTNAK